MKEEILKFNISSLIINPYLSAFLISLFITYLTIPLFIRLAKKYKLYDQPDDRKFHEFPTIRIGGISIIAGFYFAIFFTKVIFGINFQDFPLILTVCVFSFCFFLIGFIDDIRSLSPLLRLFFQILIACAAWNHGLKISFLNFGFSENPIFSLALPNTLSILVTLLWIVGTINAINWIDGLDGLAGGIIFISSFSIFALGIYSSNIDQAILSTVLCGSTVGFLKYNIKPAKIFMGDGGSYFFGFMLSALLLISSQNINNSFNIADPLFLLSVPLIDMVYVIFSRIINGNSPFYPDNNHIHHRIMSLGLKANNTVYLIWLASLISVLIYLLIKNINLT